MAKSVDKKSESYIRRILNFTFGKKSSPKQPTPPPSVPPSDYDTDTSTLCPPSSVSSLPSQKTAPPVIDDKQWETYGARPKIPTRSQPRRNQKIVNYKETRTYNRPAAQTNSVQQSNITIVKRPLPPPPLPATNPVAYKDEDQACKPPSVKSVVNTADTKPIVEKVKHTNMEKHNESQDRASNSNNPSDTHLETQTSVRKSLLLDEPQQSNKLAENEIFFAKYANSLAAEIPRETLINRLQFFRCIENKAQLTNEQLNEEVELFLQTQNVTTMDFFHRLGHTTFHTPPIQNHNLTRESSPSTPVPKTASTPYPKPKKKPAQNLLAIATGVGNYKQDEATNKKVSFREQTTKWHRTILLICH